VSQFRTRRDGPILAGLQDRLAEWGRSSVHELAAAEPAMPVEDRAADTWEPLVAIADHVGGDWPRRARTACLLLTAEADEADEDGSLNTRLLSDVRGIFMTRKVSFLTSTELVEALGRIDESPWSDFDFNARKLAFRLKHFGVKPGFNTAKTARGYRLEHLHDAFSRYLRPDPSGPSETGSDQRKPSDASEASDGYIRPDENIRPEETAGPTLFRTLRTVPDAPPAEIGRCERHPDGKRVPNGCFECIAEASA
jgi:hypothetical protein